MTDSEKMRRYVEDRCIPEPMSGCWIWLLSIGSHGYGQACTDRARVTVAHRVSFAAFVGPIPDGMLIQHSCDNRWCVAPHHLSIGTDATNAIDKQRKGRAAKKLTARDVRAIKLRLAAATESDKRIGRDFGVSGDSVACIRRRETWTHVA
jgi:hypothetical protein